MRATIRLQLRKDYVREDGKQQLVLRYLAHQKSSYIGLGISIYPKHWWKKRLTSPLSGKRKNCSLRAF